MTLKEKLCEPFGGVRTETINQLEIIAKDFAIGFAEWINTNKFNIDYYVKLGKTDEIINQYKKENQL